MDDAESGSEGQLGGEAPQVMPEQAAEPAGAVPRPVPPVVVPRWVQLVVLLVALLLLWQLVSGVATATIVVIAAAVVALILNPLTKQLQRLMPRGIAIALSYLILVLIFVAIGALLAAPVSAQLGHFIDNFPQFVKRANHDLLGIQKFLNNHGLKVHIAGQGHSALQSLQQKVLKNSGSILSFSRDVLGKLVTLSVDLVLTFVLSVYMLAYAGAIGKLTRRLVPPGDGTPADDYPLLIQKAVSGYVRVQLLFSLIMGVSAGVVIEIMGLVGLFPDGSHYAVFFGVFYGLMELVPYVGPVLGAIPPMAVALVTHPVSMIWLLIAFIALQQLEGHVVAPQVFRIALRINPIVVILALMIGGEIYGIAGALLALPVATVVRQTILYLRKHLVLEPWSTERPLS